MKMKCMICGDKIEYRKRMGITGGLCDFCFKLLIFRRVLKQELSFYQEKFENVTRIIKNRLKH